jgi:FkbM family methyltransferase
MVSRPLPPVGRSLFRAGRAAAFSTYYAAVRVNHRRELYAPRKRVGDASFRSYELVNKHGRDLLLRRLLDACGPDEVVYDVGANTGVYSLAVAASVPGASVVAFEPNPDVREHLSANVRLNGFENVDVRGEGVGDRSGARTFYRSTYDELGSFRRENAAGWEARVRDAVEVPVATLDGVVARGEAPPPDHLKVDVEGFGREVLTGARETLETHRPAVYFEPHDGEDLDAIGSLLEAAGYAIRTRPEGWIAE